MNLLDPTHISPEVLRRAFALYRDTVLPARAPHVWEEDDHDIGLDGRFNLSLLGRYIEESYRLDLIARLKPDASAEDIEEVVRLYGEHERTGFETDRFVRAMKVALGLKRHQVEALVKAVGKKVCAEKTIEIAREIAEWCRVEKEARKRAKVSQDG